jgi:uncharacterized protein YdbL (DUF1318 family)
MRKRTALLTLLAAGFTFIIACITVNIYFPEATVKKAAEEIVDEIRKKDEKDKQEAIKSPEVFFRRPGFSLVPMAWAQEETSVSTPAIRALKDSLKNRFPGLKPYFDGGNIGETNKGLVEIRDKAGLNLKDKAALRNLVKDENADRMKLYAEVAKALNIDAGQLERVQKIFAESWIRNASPGWWVQNESGQWVKKS